MQRYFIILTIIRNSVLSALSILMFTFISQCSSTPKSTDYNSPEQRPVKHNLTLKVPSHEAWERSLAQLKKQAFFIENSDRDAGIISLSFRLNEPATYVTCGSLSVKDKRLSGTKHLEHELAAPIQYIQAFQANGQRLHVRYESALSGQASLFFTPRSNDRTQLSVNVLYVLTTTNQLKSGKVITDNETNTYYFSTLKGYVGFKDIDDFKIRCRSKGVLEQSLLNTTRPVNTDEEINEEVGTDDY